MDCSTPGFPVLHHLPELTLTNTHWVSDAIQPSRPLSSLSPFVFYLSSNHVWMWELDHKEGRVPKNWCFWTVVLEKTLESPLDSKEIKSVNSKGNQHWILISRTEAEAPTLWLPDAKSWLLGKDPDAGEDWRQEEKGKIEGRRRRGRQRMRWLDGITDAMDMSLSKV